MKVLWALALLASFVGQRPAEWWADFTPTPTYFAIEFIERPFVVRSVEGVVSFGADTRPAVGLLFEIEGPGTLRQVRRARTDARGRFKIGHVRPGTYKFNTMLDGFNPVSGTIVVSKKATARSLGAIAVRPGT
jgi:hypothetical protein